MELKGVSQFEAPEGSQQAAVVCLYSVDLPMPAEAEGDSQVIAEQCVRMVPHPIMGQVATFAVSMDVALVALETAKALKTRDERIEALEERIRQLESGSN